MSHDIEQNPFDSQFNPDASPAPKETVESNFTGCHCDLSRRQTLLFAGSIMMLPFTAAADSLVPCVQTKQKITPCQHKFCRHYRGDGDYYGR